MTPGEKGSKRGQGDSQEGSDQVPRWMRLFPVVSIGSFLVVIGFILSLISTPQASGPRRVLEAEAGEGSESQLARLEIEADESKAGVAEAGPEDTEESLAEVLARAAAVEAAALKKAGGDPTESTETDPGNHLEGEGATAIPPNTTRQLPNATPLLPNPPSIQHDKRAVETKPRDQRARDREAAKRRRVDARLQAAISGDRGNPVKPIAPRSKQEPSPAAPAQAQAQSQEATESAQKTPETAAVAARSEQCDLSSSSGMGNLVTAIEGNVVKVDEQNWNVLPTAAREQLAQWMFRCIKSGEHVSIVSSTSGLPITSYHAESGFEKPE